MPRYATRQDGAAALLRIAVSVGDSLPRAGRDVASAIGLPASAFGGAAPAVAPRGAVEFRARVATLYDAMQTALQRGDLAAFGAAYAQLGELLGHPRAPRQGRARP